MSLLTGEERFLPPGKLPLAEAEMASTVYHAHRVQCRAFLVVYFCETLENNGVGS